MKNYRYTPERAAEAITRGLYADLTREAAQTKLQELSDLLSDCCACLEMEFQHRDLMSDFPTTQYHYDIELLAGLAHAFDVAANPEPVSTQPEMIS
jgi:hypothetical protein